MPLAGSPAVDLSTSRLSLSDFAGFGPGAGLISKPAFQKAEQSFLSERFLMYVSEALNGPSVNIVRKMV
jgi:hypothetical protein